MKRNDFMKLMAGSALTPLLASAAGCDSSEPPAPTEETAAAAAVGATPINTESIPEENIFPTVAALKQTDPAQIGDYPYVQVLGYYEAGDGGGGLFYWDTATEAEANGGTVIASTLDTIAEEGQWKRLTNGLIKLRWFGARGDGSTDDSLAYTRAAEAAYRQQATLMVSGGTYLLEGVRSRVGAVGVGNPVLKLKDNADTRMIIQSGTNITYEGIIFDGNEVNNKWAIGDNRRAHGQISLISNVGAFGNGRTEAGFNETTVYPVENVTIQRCVFENSRHVPVWFKGLEPGQVFGISVLNCYFHYAPGGWIAVAGSKETYPHENLNVNISGNYFKEAYLDDQSDRWFQKAPPHSNGFYFDRMRNLHMTNNYIENTGRNFSKLAMITDIKFTNNTCVNIRGGFQYVGPGYDDTEEIDLNIDISHNTIKATSEGTPKIGTIFFETREQPVRARGVKIAFNDFIAEDVNNGDGNAIFFALNGYRDIQIFKNRFVGWDRTIRLHPGAGAESEIHIEGNTFTNPSRDAIVLTGDIDNADQRSSLHIINNVFEGGNEGGGTAPVNATGSLLKNLYLTGNTFKEIRTLCDVRLSGNELNTLKIDHNAFDKGIIHDGSYGTGRLTSENRSLSIHRRHSWETAFPSPQPVAQLSGYEGQTFTIQSTRGNIRYVQNDGVLHLLHNRDYQPTPGSVSTFIVKGGITYEISRSSQGKRENGGTVRFSGSPAKRQYRFAHELEGAPDFISLTPMSEAANGINRSYSYNRNEIIIELAGPPPAGNNNLVYSWHARLL